MFDPDDVISAYSLQQAIEDECLVEIFKDKWGQLSGGKPIVASAGVFEDISVAGLLEIWNEYVVWKKKVMPALPEEERLFSTKMNMRSVWVLEDEVGYTLAYPEDY